LHSAAVMLRFLSTLTLGVCLLAIPLTAGPASQAPKAAPKAGAPPKATVNANAAVMADFQKRVEVYVALLRKTEATLPKLSKQTDPKEIDGHERSLGNLMRDVRKTAKPGDIFSPAMQRVVRTLLRPIFAGKEGLQIKNEILDKEYKGDVKLVVNGRYPDEVPLSTMPPQVLASLPKLPEELEYRFIRNTLILFDNHAHLIVDFVDRAFI
jgi:hypothetical protein